VGVGVRAVIRLVPWDNPRQASGTRVKCQVRPNNRLQLTPYSLRFAAAFGRS
jgi:hypothetical protein